MTKTVVIIGALLAAGLPWMSGGQEATATLISVFALGTAGFLTWRSGRIPHVSRQLTLGAILWVGWGAASLLWSVNRYQTELWILYALLAVGAFAITASLPSEEKGRLVRGLLWVVSLAAAVGIVMYVLGSYDRLTSTFYWANPAAAYFMAGAIMLGAIWLQEMASSAKALLFTSFFSLTAARLMVVLTAAWLTDSRGATLAFGLVLGGSLVMSRRLRQRWIPIVAMIGVTVVAAFGLATLKAAIFHTGAVAPGSRYSQALEGDATGLTDRLNYLKSSLQIWADHPLLGTGAGTFATIHPRYQLRVVSASSDAHNLYAQTLAEQGLMGETLLLLVVALVLLGVTRTAKSPAGFVAAAPLIGLLMHFGLDIDARYPALIVMAATLAGVVYTPSRTAAQGERWQAMALAVGLLVLAYIGVGNYQSDRWYQRGKIYDNNHDLTTAADSYRAARQSWVYDPDVWTAEGIDYYTLAHLTNGSHRQLAIARDRANQAIRRDPEDSQHYLLLARTERLDGNPQAALAAHRQALQRDSFNHADYYVDLAILQLQIGDAGAAKLLIKRALGQYGPTVIANRTADASLKPSVAQLQQLDRQIAEER